MKASDRLFYWILLIIAVAPMLAIAIVNGTDNEG